MKNKSEQTVQASLKNYTLMLLAVIMAGCRPSFIDISPNSKNGALSFASNSTAGVMVSIAGNKNALYAVSLNAGIWKCRLTNRDQFTAWEQLQASPRYTSCIAVDPLSDDHIVAGEKEGDATLAANNHCGIWESFDGGKSFPATAYFDPTDQLVSPGNTSHVVAAITFTVKSTIIAATAGGLLRKQLFGQYTKVRDGVFTALSVFKDYIVARTMDSIFISHSDGLDWKSFAIQLKYPAENFTQNYNPACIGPTGGIYSVAIIQLPTDKVYVYVPVTRASNDPNFGSTLIFDLTNLSWKGQDIPNAGLGISVGGRVFMKSFELTNSNLDNTFGARSQLVYCLAQDLVRATNIKDDGTPQWERFVHVPFPSNFHTDMWDFHIDPTGWYAWTASDGGMSMIRLGQAASIKKVFLDSTQEWGNFNDGLHTHHIHSMVVSRSQSRFPLLIDSKLTDQVSYSTSDNESWINPGVGADPATINLWSVVGGLGDVNYTFMDEGQGQLVLNVRTFTGSANLQSFGPFPPAGTQTGICTINNQIISGDYGIQKFQVIQTLNGEDYGGNIDAWMLSNLPIMNVTDALGTTTTTTAPALLRNRFFNKSPDLIGPATGWQLVFNDLPEKSVGLWVSGGHMDPTFYIINETAAGLGLFKKQLSGDHWIPLTCPDILPRETPCGSTDNSFGEYGPLYVNPFDPKVLYVNRTTGIWFSTDGGNNFQRDDQLTNLVSGSGIYSLDHLFAGGNNSNVVGATRAIAMTPLSCMAFNAANPAQIVAASPFTGIFFKDGNGKWKDETSGLPKPYTPISCVGITSRGIYVATEGRGLLLVKNY